jgi:energy-coupling factor transport system permease protein
MVAFSMLRKDFLRRSLQTALVVESPLRQVDPRVKLLMSLCASLMVMLSLERLAIFMFFYFVFLAWARLIPIAARQIWRLRWLLLAIFVLDAWLISWELAFVVTLRLVLLAGVFSLLVATTTPRELSLALESLKLPYRYAFSLSLAFQSLGLLEDEWRSIQEAQLSRGISFAPRGWREILRQVRRLTALTVPAIVLTTKRAWSITEAAYARGFDSPHRRPYRCLKMSATDWLCVVLIILITISFFWRWQ